MVLKLNSFMKSHSCLISFGYETSLGNHQLKCEDTVSAFEKLNHSARQVKVKGQMSSVNEVFRGQK